MKIYLLILALVILSQAKFRNLRNLTIDAPAPPQIICLSPTEIAYESQSTIFTYNLTNNKIMQNVSLSQQTPLQFLSQHSALIYLNDNTIYQIHSDAEDEEYISDIPSTSWPAQISSFKDKFITTIYDKAGSPRNFKIYGPTPWDIQTITWDGFKGQDITGGSGPNLVSDSEFYFASGGQCSGTNGLIYFQRGSVDSVQNIYNFTLGNCNFGERNRDWTLQTYQLPDTNYHLLTYVSSQDAPFRYTSQLVSSQKDNFTEVAHFDMDKVIGVFLASQKTIYTADNLLCRVVEHDILNHEHEHKPSVFNTQPFSVFVTPSQNLIVTTEILKSNPNVAAVVYKVDANQTISQFSIYYVDSSNITRAQILGQTYIFYYNNVANSSLSLFNIFDGSIIYNVNLYGIVDFCVSNQDKVFVLHSTNGLQVLGVYSMVNDVFTLDSNVPLMGLVYQTISCLDNNYVLLNPAAGRDIQIYQFTTSIVRTALIVKDAKIHTQFAYANDILIFTNSDTNQSVFYDYNFNTLNQTFNLPPSSNYQIIQSRKGELIIAVGNDVDTYSSLEYYKNQNSTIVYKGSFPFIDDGIADIPKTILFPSKGSLHIEFQSQSSEWSTYFDLASPPLQAIGYFYDAKYNDCSFFESAVFRITPTTKELLLLNNNNNYPILQKYIITNKLTKTQSYPLTKYLTTKIGLQLTNNNQLIIRGIFVNRTFNFQVRNLDLLSTIIYTNVELDSINNVDLQTVDYVNEVMISLFSTNKTTYQTLNLLFCVTSRHPLALQTSIFSAITLFAACYKCNKVAYSGVLTNSTLATTVLIGDYSDPTTLDSLDIGCTPTILALSPTGNRLAWGCSNSQLFAYDFTLKAFLNLTYPNYTKVYELTFVDEFTLLTNLDQTIQRATINIFNVNANTVTRKVNAGLYSSYAIDYTQQIYAIAVNSSTIQLYNFNDAIIETFTINNTLQIASLSFNSNGELYVANSAGAIFAITSAPCSFDRQLVGDYCLCRALYVQNGDQCNCRYKALGDGSCGCEDGNYVSGQSCESCAAMCSTCNSGDAFDCIDFSAGFYILIVGLALVLIGIVFFVIIRIMKKKKRTTSMLTQEKTKLGTSQPSLKEQIMVRSSFQ